jgi:hypothetical protein
MTINQEDSNLVIEDGHDFVALIFRSDSVADMT